VAIIPKSTITLPEVQAPVIPPEAVREPVMFRSPETCPVTFKSVAVTVPVAVMLVAVKSVAVTGPLMATPVVVMSMDPALTALVRVKVSNIIVVIISDLFFIYFSPGEEFTALLSVQFYKII
jgi:hypothetical protein